MTSEVRVKGTGFRTHIVMVLFHSFITNLERDAQTKPLTRRYTGLWKENSEGTLRRGGWTNSMPCPSPGSCTHDPQLHSHVNHVNNPTSLFHDSSLQRRQVNKNARYKSFQAENSGVFSGWGTGRLPLLPPLQASIWWVNEVRGERQIRGAPLAMPPPRKRVSPEQDWVWPKDKKKKNQT